LAERQGIWPPNVGQLGVFGCVNGRPLLGDKGEQKTVAANAYRACRFGICC
jgi:hypothetical protein